MSRPPKTKPSPDRGPDPPPAGSDAAEARARQQIDAAATRQSLAALGLLEILGSRKKLMWINFVAGLARGVGFFLGVSIVGGLLLGATAIAFDKTAETLGFKDVSLRQVVQATFLKFQEIQDYIEEARRAKEKADAEFEARGEAYPVEGTGLAPKLYRPPSSKLMMEPPVSGPPPDALAEPPR